MLDAAGASDFFFIEAPTQLRPRHLRMARWLEAELHHFRRCTSKDIRLVFSTFAVHCARLQASAARREGGECGGGGSGGMKKEPGAFLRTAAGEEPTSGLLVPATPAADDVTHTQKTPQRPYSRTSLLRLPRTRLSSRVGC